MQDYIFSVISFSAIGTVALGLLPLGDDALKKAFSLLLSLIMILVIGDPLISFIKSYDGSFLESISVAETSSYEEVWLEALGDLTKKDADAAVLRLIAAEFSLNEDEIKVDCLLKKTENSFALDDVDVILSGKGKLINPRRVESFLNEKLGCKCRVK